MGSKKSTPEAAAAERLRAAGRLEEFVSRGSQGDGETARQKSEAAAVQPAASVGQAPSAGASERDRAAKELAERVAGIRELLKQVPKNRKVSLVEVYEWVAEHLECEAAEIDVVSIPNRAALTFLITAVSSDDGREHFLTRHKSLTSKAPAEDLQQRFRDDGRKLGDFAAKVRAVYEEERLAGLNRAIDELAKVTGAPASFKKWAKEAAAAINGEIDEDKVLAQLEVHAKAEAKQSS